MASVGEELEEEGAAGCCRMKKAPLRLIVMTVGLWPLKLWWRRPGE
jgi:hypothetical protein